MGGVDLRDGTLVVDRPPNEVDELEAADFWGPAMPLEEMYGNLFAGTNIWIAPEDQMTPHLEAKFPGDEFDEASLSNAIRATVGGETIPVGPLELQITYKLSLGGRTDLEDAAHIYSVFGERLSTRQLEQWAERLGVSEEYARLRS